MKQNYYEKTFENFMETVGYDLNKEYGDGYILGYTPVREAVIKALGKDGKGYLYCDDGPWLGDFSRDDAKYFTDDSVMSILSHNLKALMRRNQITEEEISEWTGISIERIQDICQKKVLATALEVMKLEHAVVGYGGVFFDAVHY